MSLAQSLALACLRCGGRFEVLPQGPSAHCPYCGNDQPLPAGLQPGLLQYQGQVAQRLHDANQAYQTAAVWQELGLRNTRKQRTRYAVALGTASGATFLVTVGGVGALQLGLISADLFRVMVTLTLVSSYGGGIAYLLLYFLVKGVTARRAVTGPVRVGCPNCGAPGELAVGQSAAACRYCRGMLLASAAAQQMGIAQAALAQRRASLEQYRQERIAATNLSATMQFGPYVGIFMLISVPTLVTVFAVTITVQIWTGAAVESPLVFVLWALSFLFVASELGVMLWFRARRRTRQRALDELGSALLGARLRGLEALVDWLERFWPGKYDPKFLIRASLDALSVQVRGYPVLVRWQHSTAQGGSKFLHVLFAAEVEPELVLPDGWHAPPLIQQALARCRQLGFTVRATEAGLFAAAHPQLLAQLEGYPAALVPSVAPLFDSLQAIVVAMGALPARPLATHPPGSGQ